MSDSFLILPGCDDRNRGDQALIWETVEIAKKAGYEGQYYMLAEQSEARQSESEGILNIPHILKHPSRKSSKNNIKYSVSLKLKWGITAFTDIISKGMLLHSWYRKAFSKFYSREIQDGLKLFESSRVSFVKGGGFLHANGGLPESYKIYYFLYHIRLALSCGHKVYVMPNSYGPFNAPFVKMMIKKTLSKCEVVMSRESISQEQLSDVCGVASKRTCDLAFFLCEDENFDAAKELYNRGIDTNKKIVGLTMRPYRFPGEADAEGKYERYKLALAQFVDWLSNNGYYPLLIEHVFDDNEHEQDIQCISDVEKFLDKGTQYSVFSNRELTCRQMKAIYSKMYALIGTRFHSVIFSISSMVPSIAITYGGNKGTGIMKDMNIQDFSIEMNSLSYEKLKAKFEILTKRRREIIDLLKKKQLQSNAQEIEIINWIKGK